MQHRLVVSFIGNDEPGLVRSIADVVTQHGGNWLESRMSQLAGRFAGIAVVEVADTRLEDLRSALGQVTGISTMLEDAEEADEVRNTRVLTLNVVGPDRPGIVHEVTRALAQHVANVVEMETHTAAAPMSGELTFSADASVEVPFDMDWSVIADQLDDVADRLGVHILLDAEADQ